jgi:hypothetical protein
MKPNVNTFFKNETSMSLSMSMCQAQYSHPGNAQTTAVKSQISFNGSDNSLITNSKMEWLKKFCHSMDCSDEDNRQAVWKQFIQNGYPGNGPKPDPRSLNYFSPLLDIWIKDSMQYGQCIDILYKTAQRITMVRDGREVFRANLPRMREEGLDKKTIYVPVARRLQQVEQDIKAGNVKVPNCAVDNIVPPSPSPFGCDYLALLVQLKFLESWGPTLDSLAPSYKASIWRISKIFEEFGSNHDMTSFRKTIARWSQSPLENLDSIRLLFSAIGYLKNAGVLKHEFFYPSKSGESLYPVFRSGNETKPITKRRRKKKRNAPEPSKDNPVVIDIPFGPNNDHPMNAQKLSHNFVSAFKPLKKGSNEKISGVTINQCNPVMTEQFAPAQKRSKLDTTSTTLPHISSFPLRELNQKPQSQPQSPPQALQIPIQNLVHKKKSISPSTSTLQKHQLQQQLQQL